MTEQKQVDSLLTRIAKATASVGVLSKDRNNAHDGYDYLSEAAVKRAVQQAIADHDIAPKSIAFQSLTDEWLKAKNGGEYNLVKLRCTLSWEDGSSVEGLGSGRDYGDKALLKAQTAAVREAWKNRLTIPTGEDPEKTDDRARPTAPRPHQRNAETRPAVIPPSKVANGNGAPTSTKLEGELIQSLIVELNKREHPDDLKLWADDMAQRKLPSTLRTPLWAAFGDRCKQLGLDPGKTARSGMGTTV